MPQIAFANLNQAEVTDRVVLRQGGRLRLDRLVAKHAPHVPFLVSVHRPGDIFAPTEETIKLRAMPAGIEAHDAPLYEDRLWSRTYVAGDDLVLITVLPQGGGGGNSGAKIGLTVAAIALLVFASWAGAALTTGLTSSLGATGAGIAGKVLTAGITVGGGAVLAAFARQSNNNTKLYGVSGGGNVARANERIPVGYGRFWSQPDLSQPDYFAYDGDNMTLYKRMTLGCGKYEILEIRAGQTTLWRGNSLPNGGPTTAGVTAPFAGTQVEFIHGQASTLVPGDVLTSSNVSGAALPFQNDPNPWLGPFQVTAPGVQVTRLQIDYSYPNGYWKTNTGTTSPMGLRFEYAPVNDAGEPTGPWQPIYTEYGDRKVMGPKRFTRYKDVPLGRYAVRAQNDVFKYPPNAEANHTRTVNWDALRGHVPDTRVREGITEVCLKIKSGQNLTNTSFSDVQVRARRLGQVWNGTTFVEGELRKCVDIYADLLTNTFYGGKIDPNLVDLAKIRAYQVGVNEFDTFDGLIRGPDTLWNAAKTVLANVRAEPVRIGAGYSFVRDEPKAVRRHTFSRRQIVRGTTNISYDVEANDGSAHAQIAYHHDTDPKRPNYAEAYYGSPSAFGPRRIEWPGLSSYEHAMHIARWLAASGFYRRAKVSFETELDGRMVYRGDPIAVDPWYLEGRAVAGIVGAVSTTLALDADTSVIAGDYAMLRDRGGQEWGPVRVVQGAGLREVVLNVADVAAEEASTGLSLANVLALDTAAPTTIIIGQLAEHGEQWLVESMLPKEKGRAALTAKLDNASVYAAIGAVIPPDNPLNWPLATSEAPTVRTISAAVKQHTSSLELQWSLSADAGAAQFEVQVSQDDLDFQTVNLGQAASGAVPIRYSDEPVQIRARAYGATGVAGPWTAPFALAVPKPLITATGTEPGAITWESQNQALRNALKQLKTQVDAQGVVNDRVAAIVSILDRRDWLQDSKRTDELKVAQDNLSAAITEVRQVSIAGDKALAQLITDLTATVGDNTSDIKQLALTRVTAEQASALSQIAISSVFGGDSAGARMRLVSYTGVGGALASWDIEVSASGASNAFAKSGMRLVVWNDAGTLKSRIQMAADRTEFLGNDGAAFAIFDATAKKILASAILANSLSAISANLGTITAGKLQSADGLLVLDLDAKALIIYSSPGVEVLRLGYHP